MLAYMLLRSALLLTVEAPEARYTLEFFPMLFALAGITVSSLFSKAESACFRLLAPPGNTRATSQNVSACRLQRERIFGQIQFVLICE